MPKKIPISSGDRFGQWTVLGEGSQYVSPAGSTKIRLQCECRCGAKRLVHKADLLRGKSMSCGCINNTASEESRRKRYKRERNQKHINAFSNGSVLTHVRVMSEYLGRPLYKEEQVHHKNGDRHDNRIENLELWSKSHPAGQRLEDKIEWAVDILERYDPTSLTDVGDH